MLLISISLLDTIAQPDIQRDKDMRAAKKIRLLEILNLNESEANKFIVKYSNHEKIMMDKNEALEHATETLIEYIDKFPNGKELGRLTNAVTDAQKDMHKAVENKFSDFKTLLSEENYAKFVVFESKVIRRMRKFMMNRGRGNKGGVMEGNPRIKRNK